MHVIDNGGPLIVHPNQVLILGINVDTATNGGVNVDYQYADFFLDKGFDEIVLLDDSGVEIDRIEIRRRRLDGVRLAPELQHSRVVVGGVYGPHIRGWGLRDSRLAANSDHRYSGRIAGIFRTVAVSNGVGEIPFSARRRRPAGMRDEHVRVEKGTLFFSQRRMRQTPSPNERNPKHSSRRTRCQL